MYCRFLMISFLTGNFKLFHGVFCLNLFFPSYLGGWCLYR